MTEMEIVLAAINQYTAQIGYNITKQTLSFFASKLWGSPTGDTRAELLSNLLLKMKGEISISQPITNIEDLALGFEVEILNTPAARQEERLSYIKQFIKGYCLSDITMMQEAIKACGIDIQNERINGKLIDLNLLTGGGNAANSLRPIIQYALVLKETLDQDNAPTTPNQFRTENTLSYLSDFAITESEASTSSGGKKKYFDAKYGFVYARTQDTREEFEREKELKEYITNLKHENTLLDTCSFQEQDPNNPHRARVEMYQKDNQQYFGFEKLDDFISKAATRNYTPKQLLSIIEQLFDTVHQFWLAGIAHKDLHAGNIKIIPDGPYDSDETNFKVQIFDFGNATYGNNLRKEELLTDWLYLLLSSSATYSDSVGRIIISSLPIIQTDIGNKHYPIKKLIQLLDPTGTLTRIYERNSYFFANALTYTNTSNKEIFNYLYQNFKYKLFTEMNEHILINSQESTQQISTQPVPLKEHHNLFASDALSSILIDSYIPTPPPRRLQSTPQLNGQTVTTQRPKSTPQPFLTANSDPSKITLSASTSSTL